MWGNKIKIWQPRLCCFVAIFSSPSTLTISSRQSQSLLRLSRWYRQRGGKVNLARGDKSINTVEKIQTKAASATFPINLDYIILTVAKVNLACGENQTTQWRKAKHLYHLDRSRSWSWLSLSSLNSRKGGEGEFGNAWKDYFGREM